MLSQKTRSRLPVKNLERPFFEAYSINLFHNVVRLDQISNSFLISNTILVDLLTPKATHHCYHRFHMILMLSACCTTLFFFCNKVRMLLTPWGRVSCISKTACFLVNYAPHSLQPGRNVES